MSEDEPRFIADTMLGSIARWLRILGYDVVYDRRYEDWQILKIARDEDRVVVTRDRALHHKALKNGLKSVYVENPGDIPKSLAVIALLTNIRLAVDFERTRCPLCNGELVKVNKERVKGKVPDRVYSLYNDFWVCTRCGNVYWVGSHWRTIESTLTRAREIYNELSKIYRIKVSP
ncbi:Mut7-C RNAse domain-containing protein [Thermogladius calderae]|nr:DUF5615 family PIN-like protein [Thermogladius calderae]